MTYRVFGFYTINTAVGIVLLYEMQSMCQNTR